MTQINFTYLYTNQTSNDNSSETILMREIFTPFSKAGFQVVKPGGSWPDRYKIINVHR